MKSYTKPPSGDQVYRDPGRGELLESSTSLFSNTSINTCSDERRPLLGSVPESDEIHIYKKRWYILFVYTVFAITQSWVWNTWGPISTSSEDAFGWDDATIGWMSNWGNIAFLVSGFQFFWLLQIKGLRWALLSSAFFLVLGAACRVITSNIPEITILTHIGQFVSGFASPVAMGASPAVSATWFPPEERVTATAISSSLGFLGVAVAFVIGPLIVPNRDVKISNTTSNSSTPATFSYGLNDYLDPNKTADRRREERGEIMQYMYYGHNVQLDPIEYCESLWNFSELGWVCLVFLLILIYFPAKPARPPCLSAGEEREKFWSGLWSLRKKGYFLIIAFTYGIPSGIYSSWSSVLNVVLKPFGITESEAGWLGFYSTLASCVCSLLMGKFAGYFVLRLKQFVLVMYILTAVSFLIFVLMLIDVLQYSDALLYVTIVIGSALLTATVPLMYELGCELAYPVSEGAANGVLTFLNNLVGTPFLALISLPHIGTMWMNWTLIGSTIVCIPLIAALKGRFSRLEVDAGLGTNDQMSVNTEIHIDIDQGVIVTGQIQQEVTVDTDGSASEETSEPENYLHLNLDSVDT